MLPETLRGKLPQTQALQNCPSFVRGKQYEIFNFDLNRGKVISQLSPRWRLNIDA